MIFSFTETSSVQKFKRQWMKYGKFPSELLDAIVKSSKLKDQYYDYLYGRCRHAPAPHIMVADTKEAVAVLKAVSTASRGGCLRFVKRVGYRFVDFGKNEKRMVYADTRKNERGSDYVEYSRVYVAYFTVHHYGQEYMFGIGMSGCTAVPSFNLSDSGARAAVDDICNIDFKVFSAMSEDMQSFVKRCRHRVYNRATGTAHFVYEPDDNEIDVMG